MSNRWGVLALLFCIRTAMAVQFQAVAALSPYVMERYGVGLADIGLLIGLYLSPGIVVALPGGAISRRFGDKRAVAFGMMAMLAGGILVALVPTWEAQVAGRLIAGIGGVILNVLTSKMVTDWFQTGNLATAMGIFVNSWPVGIAAALVVLPVLAGAVGLTATLMLIAGLVAAGLAALLVLYQPPGGAADRTRRRIESEPLGGKALAGTLIAGGIWGLYNAAVGMIFGFAPAMLAGRGWSVAAASSTTSIVLWLMALAVPLGGLIADRTGRRDMVIFIGLTGFAITMAIAPLTGQVIITFAALGFIGGLVAGPIMSLPGDVLSAGNKAKGMGLFFTIYYAAIFIGPVVGGWLAEAAGGAGATLTLGGGLLIGSLCLLVMFRVLTAPRHRTSPQ